MKKITAIILTLILCLSFGLSALAATISPDQAKAIALESITYTSLIYNTHELTTSGNGAEAYKVSTLVEFADGTYTKYTTLVDANNGEVIGKSCKLNTSILGELFPDSGNDGIYLNRDKALINAYKAFCINSSDVTLLSVKENSVGAVAISYDITFAIGYGTKYTCTVYAETGVVDAMEIYQPADNDFFGRIMLAIEIITTIIKNKIAEFIPFI